MHTAIHALQYIQMYAFSNDIWNSWNKNYCFQPFCRFDIVHREFCKPDVTENVETGHSCLNNRTYLSIAKEYFNSVTCVIKPDKCHDHVYLLCLMTVKIISLLNFMCQHGQVLHAWPQMWPNLTKPCSLPHTYKYSTSSNCT